MSSHNVLVLATGNDSSGGAAHALLQRCRDNGTGERWWVTLLADSQLRVEHALSLTRADLCLFLLDEEAPDETAAEDGAGDGAAHHRRFSLRAIDQGSGHQMASSEGVLSPEDLLHTLATLGRRGREPRCYALALHPDATGEACLDEAMAFLADLLEHPQAGHWDCRQG